MTAHDMGGYVIALVLLAALSCTGWVLGAIRRPEDRTSLTLSWVGMILGGFGFVFVLGLLVARGVTL